MNFLQWQQYRDDILKERAPLRLDCLDPFTTMGFLKRHFTSISDVSAASVLDLWAERMQASNFRAGTIATPGVRESLKALFSCYAQTGKQMILPEDVYPFYWQEAAKSGLKPVSFRTLPQPDFTALASANGNSAVLITSPLSPLGRDLQEQEITILKAWLDESKDRMLILDTVYNYRRSFDETVHGLYEHGQTIIAHSLSKGWLERGIFGTLSFPAHNRIQEGIFPAPSTVACNSAFAALDKQEMLADIQQHSFRREWARLAPSICEFAPEFRAPQNGYMAVIPVNAAKILETHNAMLVPASVFGSSRSDLSVITCLQDLHRHHG